MLMAETLEPFKSLRSTCKKSMHNNSGDFGFNFFITFFDDGSVTLNTLMREADESFILTLLGEAPMQTQATAQKYREMPMGRTGIAGLRLFIRWLRDTSPSLYVA